MMQYFDTIIIGGGAAGFYAAFAAAKAGASVLILERQRECLRKFAAAGNGRCNLGNLKPEVRRYHSVSDKSAAETLLASILQRMTARDLMTFYAQIGVPLTVDHAGRIYPYCEEGNAVRDVLISAAKTCGITIRNEVHVHKIDATEDGFIIHVYSKLPEFAAPNPPSIKARTLILACGSDAAPGLGGKGSYELAEQLGLELTSMRFALCPLLLGNRAFLKKVSGMRFNGAARIMEDGETLITSEGEFLFAKDGISGIAGMELARAVNPDKSQWLAIDFFPEYSKAKLYDLIADKIRSAGYTDAKLRNVCPEILKGLFRSKLAVGLAGSFSAEHDAEASVNDAVMHDLVDYCKNFRLPVRGIRGAEAAQVVAGGVATDVLTEDCAVKSVPGLYLAGEMIDIDGDTGGFNLHWAFASGTAAGKAAAHNITAKKRFT